MPFEPQHILLTGAAGAIGSALTEIFLEKQEGSRITLVDLPGDALQQRAVQAGARCCASGCDLSDIAALPSWWETVVREHGEVDLLINCAGFMELMSFAGTPWETGKRLLDVDLVAPLRLMDLALPAMLRNGHGAVINIASMAGRLPIKGCSYYGAAKAGLGNASEIARIDHARQGIEIITVYPGPIYSGLESHARSQVTQGLVSRYLPTGDPQALAERIHRAFARGEARVIYPDVYGIANHVANLSMTSWLMHRISPQPNQ